MTEELLASFQRFSFSELDQVPEAPGLYAWYGKMRLGAGTWGQQVEGGVDLGEQNSRRALQLHTERHSSAPLEVNVETAFSASWSGTLQDDAVASMKNTLEYVEESSMAESDRAAVPKLQSSMYSSTMRELVFKTLEKSAPILSSPLYIGVAIDLRKRLHTHSHNLQSHRSKSKGNFHYFDNISDPKILSSFAFRAARQGFSPDTLEVWVLNLSGISTGELSLDQQRTVAEACEWLLNRWHRPQLGRR